jgi:hypothetical protein
MAALDLLLRSGVSNGRHHRGGTTSHHVRAHGCEL